MLRSYANLFVKFFLLILLLPLLCYGGELIQQKEAKKNNKTVFLAILARNKAHVLPKFLHTIDSLDYDKRLITIYINTNNNIDNTKRILKKWAANNLNKYRSIIFESHNVTANLNHLPHDWTKEKFSVLAKIRNKSLALAKEHNCDYYFVVDCDNFIKPETLSYLINKEKPIIAPMLRALPDQNDIYSNFFAAVNRWGYCKSSPKYHDIVRKKEIGTFKVPVVHCTYLIDCKYIDKLSYEDKTSNYEFVIFSRSARKHRVDQYICNERDFGTLIHMPEETLLEEEVKVVNSLYPTPASEPVILPL